MRCKSHDRWDEDDSLPYALEIFISVHMLSLPHSDPTVNPCTVELNLHRPLARQCLTGPKRPLLRWYLALWNERFDPIESSPTLGLLVPLPYITVVSQDEMNPSTRRMFVVDTLSHEQMRIEAFPPSWLWQPCGPSPLVLLPFASIPNGWSCQRKV